MAAMEAKQFDAILSPVCALPALTHGSSNFLVQDATYTIPYNLLGMPAGVVSVTRVRPGEESDSVRRSHSDVSEARRSPGASALLRLRKHGAEQQSADRAPSTQLSEQTASKVEQGSVGLPVGVQVAARHWREDIVLAVMAAIEEHFQSQPDYPVHPPV
jgi:fatty acid amide hydrolase